MKPRRGIRRSWLRLRLRSTRRSGDSRFRARGCLAARGWGRPSSDDSGFENAAGISEFFVQPIGFLCDHVEILYDIDIIFTSFAEKEEMRLWRRSR